MILRPKRTRYVKVALAALSSAVTSSLRHFHQRNGFQEEAKSCWAERFATVGETGDGILIKASTVPAER